MYRALCDRLWKLMMDATGVSYGQCFFVINVQGTLVTTRISR